MLAPEIRTVVFFMDGSVSGGADSPRPVG